MTNNKEDWHDYYKKQNQKNRIKKEESKEIPKKKGIFKFIIIMFSLSFLVNFGINNLVETWEKKTIEKLSTNLYPTLQMSSNIEKFVLQPILENDNIPTEQEKQLVKASYDYDKKVITKLLSNNKLNVDAKNEFGTTALMAASRMGHADLVKLLLEEYEANPNIENFYGRTALMLSDYSSLDTIKTLLSNGADVHVKNKCCGSTTLMLVAGSYNNYIDVTKLLISYGADVNDKDNEGKTAIDYAQEAADGFEWETLPDKEEIIQLLQKNTIK